jgi:hypothetical protein
VQRIRPDLLSSQLRLAAAALVLVSAALALASMARASLTYDESTHFAYGAQILGGRAARFDDSKMPVSALQALPGSPQRGRYVTVLFLLGIHMLVFRFAHELYGPAGALLALFLSVFDPNLLAHGRLVTNDVPLAFMVLLACFTLRAWVLRGGNLRLAAAALAFGAAQATKYTSAWLVPLFLLVALLRVRGRPTREDLRRFAGASLAFVAATLVVLNAAFLLDRTFTPLAAYPFRSGAFQALGASLLGSVPLPLPYPYVEGLDWVLAKERDGVGYIWLLGELRGGKGFAGYFFWVWLLKVPLGAQVLAATALVAFLRSSKRRFLDDELFVLVPAVYFLLYFGLLSQAQWGVRFLLPVFPLAWVFCGSLLADWPTSGTVARRATLVTAATVAVSVASWHPHHLSYFNEIVWRRSEAWRYLADSNLDWGQNQWYLDRWLEQHPGARVEPRAPKAGTIVVGVNKLVGVFNPPRYRWLRENFEPVETVAYTWLVYEVPPERLRELGLEGRPE